MEFWPRRIAEVIPAVKIQEKIEGEHQSTTIEWNILSPGIKWGKNAEKIWETWLDLWKQVLLIEFYSEPKRTLPEYNHAIFLT